MDIKYNEDFNILIVKDLFGKDINEKMFKEAINLKEFYEQSTISVPAKTLKTYRTNTVAYPDNIFNGRRHESDILKNVDLMLTDSKISDMLKTIKEPLGLLGETNYNETQISRYGDDGQEYKFHKDKFNGVGRLISFVYYINKTPKKYTGGDITFSKSPVLDNGDLLDTKASSITLTPENNMGVFFPSSLIHGVMPTKSPTEFDDGRFSLNCWVGIK